MKIRLCSFLILALLLCVLSTAGAETSYDTLRQQTGVPAPHLEGWLEIPGAGYVQPIMRHPQDDSFYAGRDAKAREASGGSLYVQPTYNASGFADPVTLVYGSSANENAPFAELQKTFSGSFETCRTLLVHTRDGTSEYRVFAALPYASTHILHYYDFTVARRYKTFFDSVFSTRALGMHLDEAERPTPKDKVLILSTSVRGDKTQRYLVMAKLVTP